MPDILNNLSKIKSLDSQNMLGSIEHLHKQVEQIVSESASLTFPDSYKNITSVVILGMGGSTLGAHVLKSLYAHELRVPVEIINGYRIPRYVSEKTLAIVSSYSGTTEEPVAAMKEAEERGAKIVVISSGGTLAEEAKKKNLPALIFSTINNPCGSPRMGLGYSLAGQMMIFHKAGLLSFSKDDIKTLIQVLEKYEALYGAGQATMDNAPRRIALSLDPYSLWYVGAEHLVGSAHVAANQMNENAKRFAGFFTIPELNHHLMEGMMFPTSDTATIAFLFFESKLYDQRVQKRFEITKKVLHKDHVTCFSYMCQEETLLGQVAEVLVFSSYLSFYTAIAEGIDPTAIPVVDFFKEQLKK